MKGSWRGVSGIPSRRCDNTKTSSNGKIQVRQAGTAALSREFGGVGANIEARRDNARKKMPGPEGLDLLKHGHSGSSLFGFTNAKVTRPC